MCGRKTNVECKICHKNCWQRRGSTMTGGFYGSIIQVIIQEPAARKEMLKINDNTLVSTTSS